MVCQRWCVTKWRVKDHVSKMVCDKVVCVKGSVCVCVKVVCERESVTKLCVKDGV